MKAESGCKAYVCACTTVVCMKAESGCKAYAATGIKISNSDYIPEKDL